MDDVEFGVGVLAGIGAERLGAQIGVGVVISEVSLMLSVDGCCVLGASVVGSDAFERLDKRLESTSMSFFSCVDALSLRTLCFQCH